MDGMNKLEIAKEVVRDNWERLDCGIFDTRNVVGDPMETIYEDDDGLVIDACWGYAYFEVFGLTDEEFEALRDYYNELREED